ncbi:FAD:protein FMN transferase [Brumimicrobium oceani]|uniref:FAD:protein FMN transferase n=1 Tax=Brumimicrobium oceani TaxID=2100725 RepID=A0A2U2XEM2_9FLAO|nr:FAD:protein FMN transferase [Brumimicrobium oceani]PWH86252.1 thiamine biosynthesis protein ApbE [Brumimicrobium oceani]
MEQKTQTWKNTTRTLLLGGLSLFFVACSSEETVLPDEEHVVEYSNNTENVWWNNMKTISGNALGTTFIIKTSDDSLLTDPQEIDDLINAFNLELSTYIPNSLISEFNENDSVINLNSTQFFKECFDLSQEIYETTEGAFDPTVYPLVSLWGFFKDIKVAPNDKEIDSVLAFVGLNKKGYEYKEGQLSKLDPRFKLVFNAIAKGQAVDVVAEFLNSKGQENYFIEIGGEIRVKGINDDKRKWIIGIDVPVEENTGVEGFENRELENYIEITNKAVATSGNYRKFYELDGRKYSHTISPITGRPVRHNLLSVTVVADDAASADAYATAFMVMGVEKSMQLMKDSTDLNIDAYLLFENKQGRIERAYNRGMNMYLMD